MPGAIAKEAGLGVLVVGSIAAIPIALAAAPLTRHAHAPAGALALPTRTDDVTLDEAYWIALGYHASSARVDPQTGQVIVAGASHERTLWEARRDLHQLLRRHQVDPDAYLICAEPLPDGAEGPVLLLSVVRRDGPVPAPLARTGELVPRKATDLVLDWATADRTLLESDRTYAALLAAAANDVLHDRRGADYWAVADLWREGRRDEAQQLSAVRGRRALSLEPDGSPDP